MKRGEIWLVSLDPTSGHEQQGMRPVLIISPEKFNALTQTPVVLPITRGSKFARTKGFAVSLDICGTRTIGVVRCDQPRALDIPSRSGKYLENVPQTILEDVLAKVRAIFS